MKEVPKKDLPEVSGGDFHDGSCIPMPRFPGVDEPYPYNPGGPVFEEGTYVDPTK
jgi:hypothetical protein